MIWLKNAVIKEQMLWYENLCKHKIQNWSFVVIEIFWYKNEACQVEYQNITKNKQGMCEPLTQWENAASEIN